MNYKQTVEYLYDLGKFGSKPGLERMQWLLDELGNPHHGLPVIHVGGTNGKGSTCCYISEVLVSAGYDVAQYSSPHLQTIRERILLNGEYVSKRDFAENISAVKEIVDRELNNGREHPTFFEILTAAMFLQCDRSGVDVLVGEVGLGGRFDATNVVEAPLVAVITNIGLEHTEVLGDNLADIAFEKGGIIKPGCRVVIGDKKKESVEVLTDLSEQRGVPLVQVMKCNTTHGFPDEAIGYDIEKVDSGGGILSFYGHKWELSEVEVGMLGEHQLQNAACALAAVEQLELAENNFNLSEKTIREGIRAASWPGRVEKVDDNPITILDGAHNPGGAEVLAETIEKILPHRKVHAVVGVLEDKDYPTMLRCMRDVINGKVFATTAPTPRSLSADDLHSAAEDVMPHSQIVSCEEAQDAVGKCLQAAKPGDVVVVWGSLYLVGEVRNRWYDLDESPQKY